jgi:hypothetical protein
LVTRIGHEHHRPVHCAVDENASVVGDVGAVIHPHDCARADGERCSRGHREIRGEVNARVIRPDNIAIEHAGHSRPDRVAFQIDGLVGLQTVKLHRIIHRSSRMIRRKEAAAHAASYLDERMPR